MPLSSFSLLAPMRPSSILLYILLHGAGLASAAMRTFQTYGPDAQYWQYTGNIALSVPPTACSSQDIVMAAGSDLLFMFSGAKSFFVYPQLTAIIVQVLECR